MCFGEIFKAFAAAANLAQALFFILLSGYFWKFFHYMCLNGSEHALDVLMTSQFWIVDIWHIIHGLIVLLSLVLFVMIVRLFCRRSFTYMERKVSV